MKLGPFVQAMIDTIHDNKAIVPEHYVAIGLAMVADALGERRGEIVRCEDCGEPHEIQRVRCEPCATAAAQMITVEGRPDPKD